jgi:3-hydroxybutyryl-CoA dehydrogenase
MDLVGVDVNLEVAKSFWEQSFHEPRWQPHPIQARMVAAGRLGRKAGRGYYDYGRGPHRPEDPPAPAAGRAGFEPGAPGMIRGEGFLAVNLERGSLGALGAEEGAVGFVALPDLGSASVVELVGGPATGEEALGAATEHFATHGKHVERVLADAPGLILGRILCQIVNEGYFAVQQGVAAPGDIDTAMRLGFNWPRGPFEWAQAIGPARVLSVLDALRSELGEERYRAAPGLRREVGPPRQARTP